MQEFDWGKFVAALKGRPGICGTAFESIERAVKVATGQIVPKEACAGQIWLDKREQWICILVNRHEDYALVDIADGKESMSLAAKNAEDRYEELVKNDCELLANSAAEYYANLK